MTADRWTPATWTPARRTVLDAVCEYGALGVVRTVLELYPELTEDLGLTEHPLIREDLATPLPTDAGPDPEDWTRVAAEHQYHLAHAAATLAAAGVPLSPDWSGPRPRRRLRFPRLIHWGFWPR